MEKKKCLIKLYISVQLLKSSVAEAFWAKIDARNMQIASVYSLTAGTGRQVMKAIEGNIFLEYP